MSKDRFYLDKHCRLWVFTVGRSTRLGVSRIYRIYRGYSNFCHEYDIYFIEWNEKCIFHEWRRNKWHIHDKNLNFLLSTKWRSHVTSCKEWRMIMCNVGPNWNHRSRSRKSENFSKSGQLNSQIFGCDLTEKMNTHTLCVCPLLWKLQTFQILTGLKEKWTSNYHLWNTTYIFTVVKHSFIKTYALYLINIFLYFNTLYIIKMVKSNMISWFLHGKIFKHNHFSISSNALNSYSSLINVI